MVRCKRARDELYAKQMGLLAVATSEGDTLKEVIKVSFLFVCFLLGNYPASGFYMPTFRNTLSHLHRQVDVSRMN